MRVLVSGGRGQLGRAVARRATRHGHAVVALGRDELDIGNPAQLDQQLARIHPDVVINAAAYTAVDKAESEPDAAFAVNRDGAGNVARACEKRGVPLVHVSTDYVFDGTATEAYREDHPIAPLNVYGASKAAGESLVHACGGTVVRTSWLFEQKGPSFVHTMLRLARERSTLRVVSDQHGCPTWADDLADALLALAALPRRASTYHYCNDEVTTWHGFATAIVEEARQYVDLACERVDAIETSDYPTAARRPAYSVLDTSLIRSVGIQPPSWRAGMKHVIAEVLEK